MKIIKTAPLGAIALLCLAGCTIQTQSPHALATAPTANNPIECRLMTKTGTRILDRICRPESDWELWDDDAQRNALELIHKVRRSPFGPSIRS